MEFTEKTKLQDILEEYPWLEAELIKDKRVAELASRPLARMMMKKATLKDASLFAGIPVEDLIDELKREIAAHK